MDVPSSKTFKFRLNGVLSHLVHAMHSCAHGKEVGNLKVPSNPNHSVIRVTNNAIRVKNKAKRLSL